MRSSKPELLISAKDLPELEEGEEKKFIEYFVHLLICYNTDFAFDKNTPYISLQSNQNYIGIFFILIDFLGDHYEFSQRHFELLNLAASCLERLYQEKIEALSTDVEKKVAQSELGDYLDKVTFVFQTAANKTESEMHREIYNSMARVYSAKADKWHGVPQAEGDAYDAKILRLREEAIEKFHLLETRYQEANETQESFERESSSPALFKEDEARPLLRRRLAPERPTSSPSPT